MTPKKARVKGTVDFLEAHGVPYFKSDVFRFHKVGKTQAIWDDTTLVEYAELAWENL